MPGLAVDKRQRKAWYLFPRTVRGWKDSLFLFFYRFHSSFPPSPLLFLNLHPSPHYLYVSALSVYFYVSTLLSSSSFFLLLPIDFLVFSRWQIGVLLNINLCSCCVYEHGRGGCVGNGRAFLSLRLTERWSFIRRGLLWLVCVGRYGEHAEENEPADPNTHKHATVYTHLELLRHTHRLILFPCPYSIWLPPPSCITEKWGPNSHCELFIIFITLLLFWEFSLTWFYYIVIRWWVLSSALSPLSFLLCHKFIDHGNWCMTAAVDAEELHLDSFLCNWPSLFPPCSLLKGTVLEARPFLCWTRNLVNFWKCVQWEHHFLLKHHCAVPHTFISDYTGSFICIQLYE